LLIIKSIKNISIFTFSIAAKASTDSPFGGGLRGNAIYINIDCKLLKVLRIYQYSLLVSQLRLARISPFGGRLRGNAIYINIDCKLLKVLRIYQYSLLVSQLRLARIPPLEGD
jgi:hypothetical protein